MAKIQKRNLDSAKKSVRRQSYEAPSIRRRKKIVPKEYQSFEKAHKGKGSCLWFLFLMFAASLAGFWYWSQQSNTNVDDSIVFSVEGPDKIISGDQATYKVEYENVDIVDMQQMELSVRWPNGFYFDEASIEPADQNATTWLLEDLKPGEKVSLEIKGQLVGQQEEELAAAFSLSYQPDNFHSDFKAKGEVKTKIIDSKLDLMITSPDKMLVSTKHDISLSFKNRTDESLENLYIDILYPDDFKIIIDSEEEDEESEEAEAPSDFVVEGDYLVLNLAPEEEKVFTVSGGFGVDSKAEQLLVVEVGNMVDDTFRRLSRVEKNILAINPKFDMSFKVNGKIGPQTLSWGETLRYQLDINNLSGSDIADMKVSALLDGQVLDWASLDTVGKLEENSISWTKEQDDSLGVWPSGETRTFTWEIKVVQDPQAERNIENIIKLNIEGLDDWQQVSSPILFTVGESISFREGVYWDLGGRRVGSGLLPPVVGEETEYLVIWSLPEATGDFDSVNVRSTLPPQVDFISETDVQGGSLEFDLAERSLTWDIQDFDNLILPLTASFIVRLTPTDDYVGQSMTVLNPTTVSAQGLEDVIVKNQSVKTSDVIADTSDPIGIIVE